MVTLPITYKGNAISIKIMNGWNSVCVKPWDRWSRVQWGSTRALETENKGRGASHHFLPTYVSREGVFSGFCIQFFICKEMILHPSFPPLWNRHNVTYIAGLFVGFQVGINDNNFIYYLFIHLCIFFPFEKGKAEAQRGKVAWLRPHNWEVPEPTFKSRQLFPYP